MSDFPTVDQKDLIIDVRLQYLNGPYGDFMRKSLQQVANGYQVDEERKPFPVKNRLEEIIDFYHRLEYHKIGLAFCTGLEDDARLFAKILVKEGFKVVSVVCKVGSLLKEEIGLTEEDKIVPGRREISCNPIMQAAIMNAAKTDLNIVFGLCLGYDSLFLKASDALCTVFVVKDRVLKHNPIQALRNSE